MNYTLRKLNCKALIVAVFCFISILSSISFGYAYDRVYGYTSGDFGLTGGFIPELANIKKTYVLNVSPRSTSAYTSVTLSYDSLADLVYYCNEHGLSTTLAYNNANGVYVAFVQDTEFKISAGKTVSVVGCLGNSDGKIYVAEKGPTGDSSTTTVPSTTAPSASKNEGSDRDSTTVTDPTSPADSTSELNALNRLVKAVYTQIKSIHGIWRTNINMYNIQVKLRRLMWDTIDGINNVTTGIYKQVDLLTGYLPRLDDIYNRLFNIQSASWASVDVENRIYSGVAGIGSRLDSIITNGEVQINTTPLEARLDKLISMYSKVNAVVLDTAAINGGQIKAAVGGELEDVMFWGHGLKGGGRLVYADSVTYTLNDVQTTVVNVPLRGMVLGTSIPSTIDDTDEVLMAGVWQGPNGKYYVSDTYNAITGEYVQRLCSITYDGSEGWKMTAKSDGMNMFWYLDRSIEAISPGREAMSSASWLGYKAYDSTFYNQSNSAAASKNKFTLAGQAFRIVVSADDYPDVASWTSYLSENPLTFWYVLSAPTGYASVDKPVVSILDRATIAIPEGDSAISADRIRITGKYETYDSYTQTADIIAAINGIPAFDDTAVVDAIANLETTLSKPSATVTADLTEVTTRLDTLIENSASKVENVTVNITEDNDAFNVFYITGDDGETQPITEFAKDLSGASGKFLSVLYRLVFSDALDSADSDLGNLEDFFTSTEPVEDTATQSADSTHEEVDIWSAF